jgi:uncharacterized protein YcaQ
LVEIYSKEVAKEFALQRLRLTPSTLGKSKNDVPSVVRAIGGLQHGGHIIELFNRFETFKPEWLNYWCQNYTLIEGHVLRGALRIVSADEYPYYFKATRSVARRRSTYQKCPNSLTPDNHVALNFIKKHGPLTPSEFKKLFGKKHPQLKDSAKKLLYDLYNYGKVMRIGRKNQKPLYHVVKMLPYRLDMSQTTEKEAKKWLFLKCLSTYGPFTVRDVAHWVGWNITETKEILKMLLAEKKVVNVIVKDDQDAHFVCREDLDALDLLKNSLPENSFVRSLFNDDALLLGYYRKMKHYFGYRWEYPQFSKGIVWRAAIFFGRELIGEAIVDMYAKSQLFKIRRLVLRKKFADSKALSKIEDEFRRHANFRNKTLKMIAPKLIKN